MIVGIGLVPLVVGGIMSIGWMIFFSAYMLAVIVLDFLLFSAKNPVPVHIGYLFRYRRKDRRYYARRQRFYEEDREAQADLRFPLKKSYRRKFSREGKIITGFILAGIYIFIGWGISAGGNLAGFITMGILVGVVLLIGMWIYHDETKIIKKMRSEKKEKKKKELKSYRATHQY